MRFLKLFFEAGQISLESARRFLLLGDSFLLGVMLFLQPIDFQVQSPIALPLHDAEDRERRRTHQVDPHEDAFHRA